MSPYRKNDPPQPHPSMIFQVPGRPPATMELVIEPRETFLRCAIPSVGTAIQIPMTGEELLALGAYLTASGETIQRRAVLGCTHEDFASFGAGPEHGRVRWCRACGAVTCEQKTMHAGEWSWTPWQLPSPPL
jgi:hypothetical protein